MPPPRDNFRSHTSSPYDREPSNQLKARKKLTSVIVRKLVEKTGDPHAKMGWNVRTFMKKVVAKYGLEIVGHPRDVRFGCASKVTGGNGQLEVLAGMWEKDEIRFEAASAERLRAARRDPTSIFPVFDPGAGVKSLPAPSQPPAARRSVSAFKRAVRDFETSFPPPPPRPAPKELVHHPSSLRQRLEKGIGEAVAKGQWPRQGRSDHKGARSERSKKRKKGRTGVKSAAWILSSDDEGEDGGSRGESRAVDDRIDWYEEVGGGAASEISSSEDERE